MKEADLIRAIRKHLKPAGSQRGRAWESDAEIVELAGRLLAVTVDDFSAEDAMAPGGTPPESLGWNLATATLSDLLAVGAEPEFMLHSVVVAPLAVTDKNSQQHLQHLLQHVPLACNNCVIMTIGPLYLEVQKHTGALVALLRHSSRRDVHRRIHVQSYGTSIRPRHRPYSSLARL